MSRKPLAALGLTTMAAVGVSFASYGAASASPVSPAAPPAVVHAAPSTSTATHPTSPAVAAPARPTRYTVHHGDSLWSIGQHYDVAMTALAAANHMDLSDVLVTGRVLILPPAGTTALAATVSASTTPAVRSFDTPSTGYRSSQSAPASSSLEQCVESRESGGNPDASNGSYWGLFQFSRSTWAAYGGNPGDYGQASAGEQQQVFNHAIADGGASNWTPYDGC